MNVYLRPAMEALYTLIPLSIVIVFIALWIFFRMSDGGQFDDMEGPAFRILQDDDRTCDASAPFSSAGKEQEEDRR